MDSFSNYERRIIMEQFERALELVHDPTGLVAEWIRLTLRLVGDNRFNLAVDVRACAAAAAEVLTDEVYDQHGL